MAKLGYAVMEMVSKILYAHACNPDVYTQEEREACNAVSDYLDELKAKEDEPPTNIIRGRTPGSDQGKVPEGKYIFTSVTRNAPDGKAYSVEFLGTDFADATQTAQRCGLDIRPQYFGLLGMTIAAPPDGLVTTYDAIPEGHAPPVRLQYVEACMLRKSSVLDMETIRRTLANMGNIQALSSETWTPAGDAMCLRCTPDKDAKTEWVYVPEHYAKSILQEPVRAWRGPWHVTLQNFGKPVDLTYGDHVRLSKPLAGDHEGIWGILVYVDGPVLWPSFTSLTDHNARRMFITKVPGGQKAE